MSTSISVMAHLNPIEDSYKAGATVIGDIGQCREPNQSEPFEAAILLKVSY
jgi:hypothetical protein